MDAKFPGILLQYVESHVQLQETFDRASSEIGEAVKAIEERNKEERNKNKAKTKSAATPKKEDKSPGPEKAKSDDTLPLWWTDKSVLPPGVAAPVPSAPAPLSHLHNPKIRKIETWR